MKEFLAFVRRIEQHMTNLIKPIAKHTASRSLMFFDPNGVDFIEPGTDMVGPAKGDRSNQKESFKSLFIFEISIFKINTS